MGQKSLSPMLGLLCAHPEAGERWFVNTIVEGVERWRAKHLALSASGQDNRTVKRKMRWWNPRDGFAAAYATRSLKALHVRAAITWPVSELWHRVRLSMVPDPARLVSVGRKGGV